MNAKILANYDYESPGVRANLHRLLNQGALGGTGKLVILPVDQGFEHGPDASFYSNPEAYDPCYHAELALEAGLSAFASSLGMIECVAHKYAGMLPLILKLNHNNSLSRVPASAPSQSMAASVEAALRLGCIGVGFTIYPGSDDLDLMIDDLRGVIEEARSVGLIAVVWSYPRGGDLSKDDETALDVISYSAHIAASLGAHIVKVKLPSAHVKDGALRAKYSADFDLNDTASRVRLIKRSCFAGKRLVVFSGGQKKSEDSLLSEVTAIRDGGGDGSIIGRNAFQRPRGEALKLLGEVVQRYRAS
jgi:class I fructose-bisphosphate aldolase